MNRAPFVCLVGCLFALLFTSAPARAEASITQKTFGKTPAGRPVTLYTLSNTKGMSVGIMDYGATIVDLIVPDRSGTPGDVVLGFDRLEPYFTASPYFGATIGRYANRIAGAAFRLDGQTYHLAANDNGNSLHGGNRGFDKQMWIAKKVPGISPSLRFSRTSPDGEEGYPGTLNVSATFVLTEENQLCISYQATTDKPTVINLTNHSYFNLAGAGSGTILHQVVTIHADSITPADAQMIPTGKFQTVAGTPWDFRQGKPIGRDISQVSYDHNYVLEKDVGVAAEVYDPDTGRVLKIATDQPGIQFYCANFTDPVVGKGGRSYLGYAAFCLETQHFPDSPNQPAFPSTLLKPGETFTSTTVYAFGVK